MKRLHRAGFLIFNLSLLTASVYGQLATPVITEAVNDASMVALEGNTRPEANAQNDRGAVPDAMELDHILIQLKRSPDREAALQQFIEDLHNPQSASFHQWLTPAQFAQSYGVATADVEKVTAWLQSKGFTVNGVQPTGLAIDISGTAAQVKTAFHTEIHNLQVNGENHIANMTDPMIPSALKPVVTGIVALHNFRPKPLLVRRGQYTFTANDALYEALVPGDLATIYNLNPLFTAGYTGKRPVDHGHRKHLPLLDW